MKITFDIDCTPEEARRLMGLPDVSPVNDALVDALKKRVEKGFDPKDMDTLMRTIITGAGAGMSEMQKMIWSALTPSGGDKTDNKD